MLVYHNNEVMRIDNRAPQEGEMVFLTLLNPNEQDIRHTVSELFQCPTQIVDDCLQEGVRPRLHTHHDIAYFPFFFLRDDWQLVEISVVMGSQFIIAILKEPMPFLGELEEEFDKSPEKMHSPGRAVYEFLDLCVHHYLDLVDNIEETVDTLESQIYDNPESSVASTIFSLKRTLHHVRRVFSDERSVVESLMHMGFSYSKPEENVYFMDLYDHINHIVDDVDSFREALSGLLDLQMAIKSDRMNSIMKTLTIVSTLFMPLSFIVGLYGTNFKVPEYSWHYGYLWLWGWILASVLVLFIIFKRRKWL
ncbi:putative metal ion transporter YfjQ [Alicyclobacillus acidoterrestris]|uniref:magnesium transporter CorA family protein n=1 Tax=Alicyclobacillus suci TaxID=2816080 RepID=UPI0011905863|nr:magnesium transporter CorA family protein [Alicyclobacillus suci]GEO26951.1 putative metal ion transporter YfjQ [Alicyclobacillus acidoterrestris]